MTTLVLQAAGAAIGSFIGGPIGAIAGRALGALAGASIDGALFSGVRKIEGPRLNEMEGLVAAEGAPVPRVYGRAKVGGQLIWATRFEEQSSTTTRSAGGGKGGGPRVRETSFSYFANLGIALCEGPITFVRRIWADGQELDLSRVTCRIHRGEPDQDPDPLIVAKEGAAHAPAYRGTAYVVFERFPLAAYGNRVPQFAFEVVRAPSGLRERIRSVNLIPGSNEFAYEPTLVTQRIDRGETRPENRNQLQAVSDVIASLDQLQALCPNLTAISLIVSWFGDDLRVGQCTIAPRVDTRGKDTEPPDWSVGALNRETARLVTQLDGRPAYGGTPSDASVIALIGEIRRRGLKVTLYPFIMMDIGPDNDLPDPHGRARQPPFPWRGRITAHPAPGQPGSEDNSAAARASVEAFVGTVGPAEVVRSGDLIICTKPDEWSFRRLVMHAARLAQAAGGVDAFIIGTEMVGLSRLRAAPGDYPFVSALIGIAADVRAILGPAVRLTYAADWTEYGAHVLGGGQEVRFPLDPLWASPAIDCVGIDYYAPISDWRDGTTHFDAAEARSCHDLGFLARRQVSGEAFDWFYATPAERAAQTRRPITDGAYGKPWIYRAKDLASWWREAHVERVGGVELSQRTGWVPASKPIWLTEIGCPAVDKGPNSPNVFPDPKSSEGMSPAFSSGARDDLVALRMLEAQIGVFDPASPLFLPAANPIGPGGRRMIAPEDVTVWAWDARPFPAFPMLENLWSDGRNWQSGHWITGRLEAAPLDRLVGAILSDYGLPPSARLDMDALVDGYVLDRPMSAREALEPLIRLFGLEARFSEGRLVVTGADARGTVTITEDDLVPDRDGQPFALRRAQESELPRELRIGYIDGEWDYRRAASRSRRLSGAARREIGLDAGIVTTRVEADRLAEAALQRSWVGRETLRFSVGPRLLGLEPGDRISIVIDGEPRLFGITEIQDGAVRRITALSASRTAPASAGGAPDDRPTPVPVPQPVRPFAVPIELPLQRAGEQGLLWLGAHAQPWPGTLQVFRAGDGGACRPVATVTRPALIGTLQAPLGPGPLWRWDRHGVLDLEVRAGLLQSVPGEGALSGLNTFAVQGADGVWEVLSAATVTPIGARRYRLSDLIRGLGGSEPGAARTVPAGALVVGVDEALTPLVTSLSDMGRPFAYRIVPPGVDLADPMVASLTATVEGKALRPLAPVHLRARRVADGIRLSWVRRGRVDADGWGLVDIPLDEATESYALLIRDDGGLTRRTLTVPTPGWLYPAATELADFGAAQDWLDLEVAQISASIGPGEARRQRLRIG